MKNRTFKAAIDNPGIQQFRFYFCVIHVESNTVVWAANRDGPISNSGKMMLSGDGVVVVDENGNQKWSTPRLSSSVAFMSLNEAGNLVLLDRNNVSIWDSFDYPSDTVVIGQKLAVGVLLTNYVSETDLSVGNYSLTVKNSDGLLQWNGLTYWKLSMGLHAHQNSNFEVDYLLLDEKGLCLFGQNGSNIVLQVNLPTSDFRIAKLNINGQFIVQSYSGNNWNQEFVGPANSCGIPNICGRIGMCSVNADSNGAACSCPAGFHADVSQAKGCVPSDNSFSLPLACTSSKNRSLVSSENFSYLGLGPGKSYFAVTFSDPDKYGIKLSVCQNFCSTDCSCLGILYKNSSGSCYLIRNQLGSIISGVAGRNPEFGYIKTQIALDPTDKNIEISEKRRRLSVAALVALLVVGLLLGGAIGFFGWRKWKKSRVAHEKSSHSNSNSSSNEEMEAFSIPGLPVRFDFEELKVATNNFSNQIGSGGFGAVYKGTLPDHSLVAVKKMTNLGVQGKREFCTEIAVIGSIHHVNLVKLRGFCAQGNQRLLVYEFIYHGSLDRTLFGTGPVLEWLERYEIALGTARGLAYLHSGCDQKIIHCDVKPENILLHDHFHPKLADFGLSKLLNPEQSSHFTTMRGTRGYLAPEWLTSSAISEKTDVYSYGMVLLELVSGRKNCSFRQQSHSLDGNTSTGNSSGSSGSGIVYFPMLALEMHENGSYLELADPRLEGRVTSDGVEKLVRIALCCVHEDPGLRPSMVNIVGMLEDRVQLGQPRSESLNFLRFYGRRFTEPSVIASGDHVSVLSRRGTMSTSVSYDSYQDVSGPR
ncbi:hypothetical protein RND81_01G217900 [Saponaria officinalis]|uniref:Receptor-like serine/threonine-protein kinase n=2 Tax=Saponaria officinalis TaxID=3572 RepID=A0AAW1NHY0_SAPOF